MLELMNARFEIVDNDEVKLIKGVNANHEFVEIRLKDNWLDVTVYKTEFGSHRCIFRQEVTDDMSINDIMNYFNVTVR